MNKSLITLVLLTLISPGSHAQAPDAAAAHWANVVANESLVSPNLVYKRATEKKLNSM